MSTSIGYTLVEQLPASILEPINIAAIQVNVITKQLPSLTHSPNATVELDMSACVVSGLSELDLPILKLKLFDPATKLGLVTVPDLSVSINDGSTYQSLTTSSSYAKSLFLYNQTSAVIPLGDNSVLFAGFRAPRDKIGGTTFQIIPQCTDQETALYPSKQQTYGNVKYYRIAFTQLLTE